MVAPEEQFRKRVDLDADYYWAIAPAAAFDLTEDPAVYAGQLSDDVATVGELLTREGGEIFLWHDLEHVTGILLRISALARP